MQMIEKAMKFALKAHKGQVRDGNHPLPYFAHVMDVLSNAHGLGGITDESMLCAAILHDVLEMTDIPASEIESKFGERTAALVRELTRKEPSEEETAGMSKEEIWQLRSAILLEEIGRMSPDAQKIKLADRLSNVREALLTKQGDKLDRYLGQTYLILEIVPRERAPKLWNAIQDSLANQSP